MPDYTMADFRAEMHRRKHGEQYGPRRDPRHQAHVEKQLRRQLSPRKRRETREPWPMYVERLITSVRARLAELEERSPADIIPCPWGAVFGGECLDPCRCEGNRKVTVGFMVAHYRLVLVEFGGKR